MERAEERTNVLSTITISPDGLATIAGNYSFIGIGENGSGVVAGDAIEGPPIYDYHAIKAFFILNSDPSPIIISDMAGKWRLAMFYHELNDGGDGIWDNNNERIAYGISYGEVNINSSGSLSFSFVNKNIFDGVVKIDSGSGYTLELVTECYKLGIPTTDAACTGGIKAQIFHVKDLSSQVVAKVALDKTKKVIAVWEPNDTDNTPYNSPSGCNPVTTYCGDSLLRSNSGVGVKVE